MASEFPKSPVELLQRMVGFNTVNQINQGVPFVEGEMAAFLEQVARAWGLETMRLPIKSGGFNLLITHQVDAAAPWLLFESHMDTVSTEGMTVEPFAAEIRDGRLYGRGACDTKGTGAAMLWSLKTLSESKSLDVNIAVLFTVDEEAAKTGIQAFTNSQIDQLNWRPLGAIVGEPTLLRMIIANNGVVRWKICTKGVATHSADPSQGRSAISAMVKVIDAVETRYVPSLQATNPLVGKAQASINTIRGGTVINMIPNECTVSVDRRIVPGEDPTTVLPAVEALLDELRTADPSLEVEQLEPFIDPPLNPEFSQDFADKVGSVLAELGYSTEPVGAAYGTDASNLADGGIPAVVLGPGSIDQAHKVDEYLELDQLQQGVRVYCELMSKPADYWS